jgi:hypothetical protein
MEDVSRNGSRAFRRLPYNKNMATVELTLTEDDARTLRDFLRDHIHALQFEVARIETKDLRHILMARQKLIERRLALLEQKVR